MITSRQVLGVLCLLLGGYNLFQTLCIYIPYEMVAPLYQILTHRIFFLTYQIFRSVLYAGSVILLARRFLIVKGQTFIVIVHSAAYMFYMLASLYLFAYSGLEEGIVSLLKTSLEAVQLYVIVVALAFFPVVIVGIQALRSPLHPLQKLTAFLAIGSVLSIFGTLGEFVFSLYFIANGILEVSQLSMRGPTQDVTG